MCVQRLDFRRSHRRQRVQCSVAGQLAVDRRLQARSYVRADANWNITSLAADGYGVSSPVFNTVERYEYDPYGSVAYLSGSFGALERSGFGQRYLHQGGRLDEVTGLYSFRFREYDPVQGRWKQADPAGYVDGGSLYQYVSGSPVGDLDPNGLKGRKCPPGQMSVPNPAHIPASNGCGGAGLLGALIPEKPWGAIFSDACNKHDICYDTCNSDRSNCDREFKEDLRVACYLKYVPMVWPERELTVIESLNLKICLETAAIYVNAVTKKGESYYYSAQDNACICVCPTTQPSTQPSLLPKQRAKAVEKQFFLTFMSFKPNLNLPISTNVLWSLTSGIKASTTTPSASFGSCSSCGQRGQ